MHLRRLRQALARYALTDSVEQASSIAQLVAEGDAEAGHAGWRNAFETELTPILQRASDFSRLRESELYFRQNASPKTENDDAPRPSSDEQSRREVEQESFAVVTRREIALLAVGYDELAKAHRYKNTRREVSPERYREIVLSATREMLTYFSQQGSSAPSARCHREAVHACVCQMIQPPPLAGPTLHDLLEAIRLQIRLDFENATLEPKAGIGSSCIQQSSFAEQQVEREFRRIVKLVAPGISGTTWMVRFRIKRFIWGIPEMLRKKSHDTADVDSLVTLVDTSKLSGWRHHSQRMKAFIPGTALLASPLPERCVVECLAGDSLGDHGCIALPQHISLVGGRESMNGPLQAAMLEIHWPRLRLLHLALRQEAQQNLETGRSSLSCGRTGSRCQPIRGLGGLGEDLVMYIGSLIMRPEGITFDGRC